VLVECKLLLQDGYLVQKLVLIMGGTKHSYIYNIYTLLRFPTNSPPIRAWGVTVVYLAEIFI